MVPAKKTFQLISLYQQTLLIFQIALDDDSLLPYHTHLTTYNM
jgi:hypothetical protein